MSGPRYDPARYRAGRAAANDASRLKAEHDREEWTAFEDEFLDEFWVQTPPPERDEAGVAESLGRTIEACRVRAHYVRHGLVTRRTRTVKTTTETTETTEYARPRPAWMDEEGLPEWYV
jgi:hypothetical protein